MEWDNLFLLQKDTVRTIFCPIFSTLRQIIVEMEEVPIPMADSVLRSHFLELKRISKRIRWFMKLANEYRFWSWKDFLDACEGDSVLPSYNQLPKGIRDFVKFNLVTHLTDEVVGEKLLRIRVKRFH